MDIINQETPQIKQLNELCGNKYMGHERATVSEAFYFSSLEKSEAEQIKFLTAYMNQSPRHQEAVMNLLLCIFHENVEFILPEGHPGFRENDMSVDRAGSSLLRQHSRLTYFIKNHKDMLRNRIKAESVFIQLLESVPVGDAYVAIAVKDKDSDYIGVTRKVAHELFPQYITLKDTTPTVEKLGNDSSGAGSSGEEKTSKTTRKKTASARRKPDNKPSITKKTTRRKKPVTGSAA